MQFGFIPGEGATDPIFIARQLQGKYIYVKNHSSLLLLISDRMPLVDFKKLGRKVSLNYPRHVC